MWQQRILLVLRQPVDLIHEENHALVVELLPLLRLLRRLADVRHAGVDRRHLDEDLGSRRRDDPRQRALAGARRPTQQYRGQPVLVNRISQHRAGPDEMLLADHLLEAPRPHPRCQRPRAIARLSEKASALPAIAHRRVLLQAPAPARHYHRTMRAPPEPCVLEFSNPINKWVPSRRLYVRPQQQAIAPPAKSRLPQFGCWLETTKTSRTTQGCSPTS